MAPFPKSTASKQKGPVQAALPAVTATTGGEVGLSAAFKDGHGRHSGRRLDVGLRDEQLSGYADEKANDRSACEYDPRDPYLTRQMGFS